MNFNERLESPPFPLTHRVPFGHDAVDGERGHGMGRPSPRYPAGFKRRAVRLYGERGGTCAETAREPGVDPGSLSDWVRRADAAQAPAGGDPFQTAEGLRGLRRGNERPKRENEILSKASAFLAGRQL
ncbi:transposase [Enorma sp.]|uniref:transposase n=1 Tax=Enorma sp. TaxID=1920692 RepID=UPI0025C2EE36|nr:transposase [Enorma sp.]